MNPEGLQGGSQWIATELASYKFCQKSQLFIDSFIHSFILERVPVKEI